MSLISLLVLLVIVGAILYLVNSIIPMPEAFKTIINVIAVVAVFLWVLQAFGLWSGPVLHLR